MSAYNDILANLATLGFDNTSSTAIYNKIAQAVGTSEDNTLQEIANALNVINTVIANKNYGKSGYYQEKALAFQYGDSLSVDPVTQAYYYATINPANQIIAQAAFESTGSGLYLKVAKLNSSTNLLEKLSGAELAAFMSYMLLFEIPGLPLNIITADANILNFTTIATYYAAYDLPTLQTNISNALNAFRDSFLFNGVFYTTDLQAFMQINVPGLKSFFMGSTMIDSAPFTGSISLTSGYFNYDASVLTSITYNAI
jgi:virulence-associated protein VapD